MIQLAGSQYSQLSDRVRGQSGRRGTYISALPVEQSKALASHCAACARVRLSGLSTLDPPPSQDSTPSLLAVRGLPALHPSPGQSGMQPFISRLGCFLTEKKKREMVFSQLHPPSAAAWCGAPTRLSSAGVIGDEPLPRLSDMNRAAQASQVCGSYSGAHPCTLWPTGTLYPDSFADISGFKF